MLPRLMITTELPVVAGAGIPLLQMREPTVSKATPIQEPGLDPRPPATKASAPATEPSGSPHPSLGSDTPLQVYSSLYLLGDSYS